MITYIELHAHQLILSLRKHMYVCFVYVSLAWVQLDYSMLFILNYIQGMNELYVCIMNGISLNECEVRSFTWGGNWEARA